MNCPLPVFVKTERVPSLLLAVVMSTHPSPLRSAIAIETGCAPTEYVAFDPKSPVPVFVKTKTVPSPEIRADQIDPPVTVEVGCGDESWRVARLVNRPGTEAPAAVVRHHRQRVVRGVSGYKIQPAIAVHIGGGDAIWKVAHPRVSGMDKNTQVVVGKN